MVDVPWWLDEKGSFLQGENGHMEYWSENHQIGWISGQYLLGSALSNIPELEHIILKYEIYKFVIFNIQYQFSISL